MKRTSLWIIMPFLISCTTDRTEMEPVENTLSYSERTGIKQPFNAANEFDQAGALHNELSESYVVGGTLPTSVSATLTSVDSIAGSNALFHQVKGGHYTIPPVSRLEYILEQSDLDFTNVFSCSSLSSGAKKNLAVFVERIQYLEASKSDYDSIYQYIVIAEDSILSSTTYSQHDKELLLITTSITRHASYFARAQKRKPRDKDWILVIANITAATDGAEKGIGEAAVMSATAGIVSNY